MNQKGKDLYIYDSYLPIKMKYSYAIKRFSKVFLIIGIVIIA